MLQPPLRVLRLFISPGHNFFGRHGQPPGGHATIEVPEIHLVAGQGIEGDRFFGFKENYKGQVTFFDQAVYDTLCAQFGVHDKTPGALRRNVIVAGVDLNTLIGREFEVQGVCFLGREECRPCYWMDHAFAPGTEKALQGRGGLRAEIQTNGVLTTQE